MLTSIYFYLALVTLIGAMFGFLAYAIHSSRRSNIFVMGEFVELRKSLERELLAVREAQQKSARAESAIHPVEKHEIRQHNSELETLRMLMLRQDAEIRLLQKDADDMRQWLAKLNGTDDSMEGAVASFLKRERRSTGDRRRTTSDPVVESEPALIPGTLTASFVKGRHRSDFAPVSGSLSSRIQERRITGPVEIARESGWKENLDAILSMLDTMERAVRN